MVGTGDGVSWLPAALPEMGVAGNMVVWLATPR